MRRLVPFILILTLALAAAACSPPPSAVSGATGAPGLKVLAVESFLADLTRNVAGDRAQVSSLIPPGVDPHAFEPSPQDVAKIAGSRLLVVNGAGLESWLEKTLQNAGDQGVVITASQGLTPRHPTSGEPADPGGSSDPHFWLDPTLAVRYVENIRDGLAKADPAGADTYRSNAEAYIAKLNELDAWIKTQVDRVPPARRLLVTNHESFGYYADRYGFTIVGTVIPSLSTEASPSAQQVAQLVETIKRTGAPAIFLETGTNPQLADQIGSETGVRVISDLYTHSVSGPTGPTPTYIDMLRYDTTQIVNALK